MSTNPASGSTSTVETNAGTAAATSADAPTKRRPGRPRMKDSLPADSNDNSVSSHLFGQARGRVCIKGSRWNPLQVVLAPEEPKKDKLISAGSFFLLPFLLEIHQQSRNGELKEGKKNKEAETKEVRMKKQRI